jgi:DNA-binding response OmpR family regulator
MSEFPKVLFASRDTPLRVTQEEIFRKAGYPLYSVTTPQDADRVLRSFIFRLVILDHTLTREERCNLVGVIRRLAPRTFVVVLHASGQDCGADLALDSRLGVDTVLRQVSHLLEHQNF